MDSFESLVAMLLKRNGYWTSTSFKVDLLRCDKLAIELPSCPRWEIDVLAYKGLTNELLVVECKSFLDSTGVVFRHGTFEPLETYKLFASSKIWPIVKRRLREQLVRSGACARSPRVTLCLAAGHIAGRSDRDGMHRHFREKGWRLFDEEWLRDHLRLASQSGYENDIAHVAAKLLKPVTAQLSKARVKELEDEEYLRWTAERGRFNSADFAPVSASPLAATRGITIDVDGDQDVLATVTHGVWSAEDDDLKDFLNARAAELSVQDDVLLVADACRLLGCVSPLAPPTVNRDIADA